MAFCTSCGHGISDDARFCPDCGKVVEANPANINQSKAGPDLNSSYPSGGIVTFPRKRKISTPVIVMFGVAGAVIVASSIVAISNSSSNQFQNALDSCMTVGDEGYDDVQIGEDGQSMYLNGSGEDDYSSLDYASEFCILNALDIPEIIVTRMNATSSLMGVQTGDWGNFSASWTYHPNNGLDVSITKN